MAAAVLKRQNKHGISVHFGNRQIDVTKNKVKINVARKVQQRYINVHVAAIIVVNAIKNMPKHR